MTIYSRTGDGGETGLPGGARLWKDAPRLETIGTLDELNCLLGLVRAEPLPEDVDRLLERLQHRLFSITTELAADPAAGLSDAIGPDRVKEIEARIDRYDQDLPPLRRFILPAGSRATSLLHVCRAVCRRAERRLVASVRHDPPARAAELTARAAQLTAYLNRLGDLLFVLARATAAASGRPEVTWEKET